MKTLRLAFIPFILFFQPGGKEISNGDGQLAPAASCAIANTSFNAGEQVAFNVYYSVANVYVLAGSGSFTTTMERLNGRPVYHIVAEGRTLPSYEWAYKARDMYETYMDAETMQPLKFVRNINEGGYKKYENVNFNKSASTAITNSGVYKVPPCVHDVVSAVFYARNINYNKLRVNDRVPINLFLDNEIHNIYVRYLGKEVISTKYGKFRTIKFKPLTLRGSIFEGGEKMTIWVTDDANKMPVRVESPIIVGKVKIDMMGFQNLKSPMTALIRKY